MEISYSVLMSVYYKEKPEYLEQSMKSIYDQTVPTDDFVLVCDGKLTDELNSVINEMQTLFGNRLNVCRLQKNGGLGKALTQGLKECKNELVARMDSDDISHSDRCEKQLRVFTEHPEYSIVGGIVEEFDNDIENITVRRVVPEYQKEILAFAKRRNPFNHPCVMFKKSDVEAAGGYWPYKVEDYHLWVCMLQKGFQGYNIQEPLLWMRAGKNMYKRRGDWKDFKSQKRLFDYMKESGFVSFYEYLAIIFVRSFAVITPNFMRRFLFQILLRRK